jgi:L-lysine exporter family protein LysE/ArgO
MLASFFRGIALGFSLIIAIGPQNAFVIKQGIIRKHVLLTAVICSLTDTFLICIGVLGFGSIFISHPMLNKIALIFGIIFLTAYGLISFKKAIDPQVLTTDMAASTSNTKSIVLVLLGLGLLNPHAYLDAVVLIGSVAAQNSGAARYYFGAGAIAASIIWFFTIAFGARILKPLFENKNSWRILDIIIGCTMLFIAGNLLRMYFS